MLHDFWVCLSACLSDSLSTLALRTPPFCEEAQSSPQGDTTWKRAGEEEVRSSWQPTFATIHVGEQPSHDSSSQPASLQLGLQTSWSREKPSLLCIPECLTHSTHRQNKSLSYASKLWGNLCRSLKNWNTSFSKKI